LISHGHPRIFAEIPAERVGFSHKFPANEVKYLM